MNDTPSHSPLIDPLSADEFAQLNAILDGMRLRREETPVWEFCEGFMAVVQAWPQEWSGPRNKNAQEWRTAALGFVEALTQADTDAPTQSAFADSVGPPTVSSTRMKAFGDAIWAVYNMREMWRSLGPRVETLVRSATPGRNDPCACGSGKKHKKCCGVATETIAACAQSTRAGGQFDS